MALWDSGIWGSSKWSTIETTVALTLDNVTVVSTGKVVHSGALAIPLADITVVVAGQDVHAGPLSLLLDDVTYSSTGQIVHNASIAIALDDISVQLLGSDVHEGVFSLALEDISVYFQTFAAQHRGGIGKKKSKTYIDSRKQVEDDIAKAIVKVTGEVPEVIEVEVEVIVPEEIPDYSAQIQEMVMQAQAMALQAEIDRLIQDELDDEESLMLLL